ncbi:MAG: phospho-sugar mutase [Mycoplasma sp.]|nr:phospho-sugar mutase [Mycoplasma sp.]
MDIKKRVQMWIDSPQVSDENKKILNKMSTEEIESAFKTKLSFGTAGIRGILGVGDGRLNKFLIRKATIGVAKLIIEKFGKNADMSVVIGHDNRHFSDEFTIESARVLSTFGIKALIFNSNKLSPTPLVSYVIPKLGAKAGIIITASHNPKNYNGYKVYDEFGCQLLPKDTNFISKKMDEIDDILNWEVKYDDSLTSEIPLSLEEDYIKDVLEVQIHPELDKKIDIVYTALHGTGTVITPRLYKKAGFNFEQVEEQAIHDPDFSSTLTSNPEDPRAFEKAIKLADFKNKTFILAADPDADRIAVAQKIDNEWIFFKGNEMGALYLNYMVKEKKMPNNPFVVSTFVSTNIIDKIAESKNIPVLRTPTGFKWVGNAIAENPDKNFILGFEEAVGATLMPITRDKDSHQAGLLAADMANFYANKGMTLVDAIDELCNEYGNWYGETIAIVFEGVDNWKEIASEKMALLEKPEFNELFGYKLMEVTKNPAAGTLEWHFDNDTWVKFRMSGTEPKFKLYFEILDKESRNNAIQTKVKMHEFIKGLIK